MKWVVGAMFAALALGALAAVVGFVSTLSALRDRHPGVWHDLKHPSLLSTDLNPSDWTVVYRFFWSGKYRELDDPKLDMQVSRLKVRLGVMLLFAVLAHVALAVL